MAWARYDDELSINRKVGQLRHRGVTGLAGLGVHVLANTWSRNQGTGGHVPVYELEHLAGRPGPKLADVLGDVGMFDVCTEHPACWVVHDFDDYSDPNDDGRPAAVKRRELSATRSEVGRRGGLAKAANAASKPPSKPTALLEANGKPASGKRLPPSPYPSPDPSESVGRESSSSTDTPPATDDDRFARTLELIVDAKTADRHGVKNPRAYRVRVRTNAADEHGELIRRMLNDGTAPELVALFVLGHAETPPAAKVPWCDDTCGTCDGTAFIDTGNGLAACPDRKAPA